MPGGALLVVRVYEDDRKSWHSRATYEEIIRYLHASDVPGVTVIRDEQGLDPRGRLRSMHSDYSWGLPIRMETYRIGRYDCSIIRRTAALLSCVISDDYYSQCG